MVLCFAIDNGAVDGSDALTRAPIGVCVNVSKWSQVRSSTHQCMCCLLTFFLCSVRLICLHVVCCFFVCFIIVVHLLDFSLFSILHHFISCLDRIVKLVGVCINKRSYTQQFRCTRGSDKQQQQYESKNNNNNNKKQQREYTQSEEENTASKKKADRNAKPRN